MDKYDPGFLESLQSEEVRKVFQHYEERGGKLNALLGALYRFWPRQPKGAKRASSGGRVATLKACASALKKVLAMDGLPTRLRLSLRQTLKRLEFFLQAGPTKEHLEIAWKESGLGKPGRRRGPTLESLIPAVLAIEFRRRFGRPSYRHILTLAQAVAATKFPPTTTVDHIRQRVQAVQAGTAHAYHDHFFS